MKIGDRIYVRGYVDEIRKDTVIVRNDGGYFGTTWNEVTPSAQPEIIYCKDCKHWVPYDWMFSEVWQSQSINDYPEDEMGCKWCDMSMKANDFCSRAERREVIT